MSAGAEDDESGASRSRPISAGAQLQPEAGGAHPHHHEHHLLVEPEEDRWRWRRKIRQDPRKLFVYRLAVAFAGLFLIILGFVTGPLPGPGGIPLVLLGLAVWASEFEWAHKLMQWLKAQLHRYRVWPRSRKVFFWVVFFVGCTLFVYLDLVVVGLPVWLPQILSVPLSRLPGVG